MHQEEYGRFTVKQAAEKLGRNKLAIYRILREYKYSGSLIKKEKTTKQGPDPILIREDLVIKIDEKIKNRLNKNI